MSNENIFNAKQDDQKVEQTNENNVGTSKKRRLSSQPKARGVCVLEIFIDSPKAKTK